MSFFTELKRRNVIRIGLAYSLIAWVVLQIIEFLLELTAAPAWVLQVLFILAVVGLPLALIFSWVYEMTPEGIRLEKDIEREESIAPSTGRKLDRIIIAFLAVTVVFLVAGQHYETELEEAGEPSSWMDERSESSPGPISNPPATSDSPSIAVLPFTTRSRTEDDQFFSDGMHDDLLTQLAKIGGLKVISRTSVLEYRDTTKNLREIGEELGVNNILEGAVQRSGQQVRINMQLIDAASDEHLWAETFDRAVTADNLFAIQSEIALAVAQALHATLTPEQQQALEQPPTSNLSALEAYRLSRNINSIFNEQALLAAKQEARRAVELDPNFAEAWAQFAYIQMAEYWTTQDQDLVLKARQSLDKARALNPEGSETAVAEAYYWYWGFLDYERSLSFSEAALKRYPNHSELLQVAGFVNRRQGNVEETLDFLTRAAEIAGIINRPKSGTKKSWRSTPHFSVHWRI
jgi:TolB-like protein